MAMSQEIRDRIVADVPVGRLVQPDEIARTVAFLAADDAGFITGANIPVNGGMFMRSEEHTSELQSLMRISYAVFGLTTKMNIVFNHHLTLELTCILTSTIKIDS